MIIRQGDPLWNAVLTHWVQEGRPGSFDFRGKRWMQHEDNGEIRFVEKAASTPFDAGYNQNSIP
jgi:hypothetical protein